MNSFFIILLIAIIISISCSILGVFLVLKKMTMLTDAITHTVLLGIVLCFFVVRDIGSPFLIFGATVFSLLTVYLIELLAKSKFIKEDAAIGIILSFLFSIAVILISKYTANVHLDIDAVLLGEIAFAPFHTINIFGHKIASSLFIGSIVLIMNVIFIFAFYKELKISIFDKMLASSLGLIPLLIHYLLMTMVSITAITSFEAVGATLMISFIVGPPITAYIISKSLKAMLLNSVFFAIISSIIGVILAIKLDVSISGMISVVIAILFLTIFFIERIIRR